MTTVCIREAICQMGRASHIAGPVRTLRPVAPEDGAGITESTFRSRSTIQSTSFAGIGVGQQERLERPKCGYSDTYLTKHTCTSLTRTTKSHQVHTSCWGVWIESLNSSSLGVYAVSLSILRSHSGNPPFSSLSSCSVFANVPQSTLRRRAMASWLIRWYLRIIASLSPRLQTVS
jgi:hypothetical protein